MTLCKWRTNSDQFHSTIPDHLIETADLQLPSADHSPKALGMHWDVAKNTLHVTTPVVTPGKVITKCLVASITAQVYDVLGLYSPFVISAKILLQQLWKDKVDWDDKVTDNIQLRWRAWTDDVLTVTNHPIARKYTVNPSPIVSYSLHGYSDASQLAYGAAVYRWHGPSWLRLPESEWPSSGVSSLPRELPETKMVVLTTITAPTQVFDLWTRYSNFSTLVRTLA